MRQSGEVVRPFSYAARFLIRGTSSGAPNWHQPTQSSPSKTSAAWAWPSRIRCSFAARLCAASVRESSVEVEPHAPAPAKDAIVVLHQRGERGPRRLVESLHGVRGFGHKAQPNGATAPAFSPR